MRLTVLIVIGCLFAGCVEGPGQDDSLEDGDEKPVRVHTFQQNETLLIDPYPDEVPLGVLGPNCVNLHNRGPWEILDGNLTFVWDADATGFEEMEVRVVALQGQYIRSVPLTGSPIQVRLDELPASVGSDEPFHFVLHPSFTDRVGLQEVQANVDLVYKGTPEVYSGAGHCSYRDVMTPQI